MKTKPALTFWQIWNLSFGFLGVQVGYSLQSSQTSGILSSLGANPDHLPLFWLAAPLAGLIVQPIVGMSSDKTWTKFGRRIPFILGGAIVAAIAMFFMPNSEIVTHFMPPVLFGAGMLLFMDCAFNVAMQPFRALVGDMVNDEQRNKGYSTQSFLINVGAIVGSFLPLILTVIGIKNFPSAGKMVAPNIIWAYYIGGTILLLTVLWTSFKVKEYSPKEYELYNNITTEEKTKASFIQILKTTPKTMLQVGVVQFFSWFALFIYWVYSLNGIAENVWGTLDTKSQLFGDAKDWNGVLAGFYAFFAAIFSIFVMAKLATKIGRKTVYSAALVVGALGFISMYFIDNQYGLILSMIGVGIAWAAILAMPYSILSAVLPASKMGVYMGIFNATITIPQIVAGLTGGLLFKYLVGGSSIAMMVVAGVSMLIAALSVVFIKENKSVIG